MHVTGADVALVGARMDGDAVRAGLERERRSTHDVRDAELAGVAQQCDLVDIDRQRGAKRPRQAGLFVPGQNCWASSSRSFSDSAF